MFKKTTNYGGAIWFSLYLISFDCIFFIPFHSQIFFFFKEGFHKLLPLLDKVAIIRLFL